MCSQLSIQLGLLFEFSERITELAFPRPPINFLCDGYYTGKSWGRRVGAQRRLRPNHDLKGHNINSSGPIGARSSCRSANLLISYTKLRRIALTAFSRVACRSLRCAPTLRTQYFPDTILTLKNASYTHSIRMSALAALGPLAQQ